MRVTRSASTWRFVAALFIALTLTACATTDDNDDNGGNGNGNGNGGGNNTPPVTQAIYIKANNAQSGDRFGQALALSSDGNTLALGAPLEDSAATTIEGSQSDNNAADAGAVYVYTRGGGTWTHQAYVKASNAQTVDQFGATVALSSDGNTLAVGAPLEDSAAVDIDGNQANNGATQAGAVYVFTRSGTSWTQQAYIKASNTGTGDEFGTAVALSADGNTLAVGARLEDSAATGIGGDQGDNLAPNSGAVYVFTRSGAAWSQQAYVKASNTQGDDWFGGAVALNSDGNTLAVGARQEDSSATGVNGNQGDNGADAAGAVYVFTRNGGAWGQEAYLKASNTGVGDWFGVSTSLSGNGNLLAIGACCEDSNATGINGDQGNNDASGAGAVYVFARVAGAWSQALYVKASNAGPGDEFGLPVVLSSDGATLVAGAHRENSAVDQPQSDNSTGLAGAVYVFSVDTAGSSVQQRFLKAVNANAGDEFGTAVGVSSNGGIVVVSAALEDGGGIGTGADPNDNSAQDAGAAYVF
jgi:hypothetical protein